MWIKKSGLHPEFEGWSDGYAILSCSFRDLNRLVVYVRNQQEHHRKESFQEEYRRILEESGLKIDDRYFP